MDDLNVGDNVIYKEQKAVIVDHYGAGVYAIELKGDWKSVHRKELTLEDNG